MDNNIQTQTITIPVPFNIPVQMPAAPTSAPGEPARLTYTRREAAAALGVSMVTFDAFCNRKDNPIPRIKSGHKLVLIPVEGLRRWIMEEAARNSGIAAR